MFDWQAGCGQLIIDIRYYVYQQAEVWVINAKAIYIPQWKLMNGNMVYSLIQGWYR